MKRLLLSFLFCVTALHSMEPSEAEQNKSKISQALSPFKHHTIPLNQLSKKKFLLTLDYADQSVFVDYQWDGKSIAQFIAGDKKMFLKSSDPEGYNFSITNPIQTGDLNIDLIGKLALQESVDATGTALVACKSFKNKKNLHVNEFHFNGEKLINGGSVNINNCTIDRCEELLNTSKWSINKECSLKQIGKFATSENSTWSVGSTWAGKFKDLNLNGKASAGTVALFDVESSASFNGVLDAPIIHIESKGNIESTPESDFRIQHHLGLKAKDSVVFQGRIHDKLANESTHNPDSDSLSKVHELFKKGVFLQSEEKDLDKSGQISVTNKPVFLVAKKELNHNHLTISDKGAQAIILSAEQINLDKESSIAGCTAQLNAQEAIIQKGKINIIPPAPTVDATTETTLNPNGLLTLNAKKIITCPSSEINAATVCLAAQETIDQQGAISAQENLEAVAPQIATRLNSSINAKNALLHGNKKLCQNGAIHVTNSLTLRSNQLYNNGTIEAENSHLKADRWLLNRGSINTNNELKIDALISINALFGLIQAKKLQTNALIDLNLLGLYKAQNADINAVFRLNAGLFLPQMHSWRDFITVENFRAASESALLMITPQSIKPHYRRAKALSGISSSFNGMINLANQWQQLRKTYTGASDTLPLISQSINQLITGLNQLKTLAQTADAEKSNPANLAPLKVAHTLAEPLFPNQNCKTIMDMNCGITSGVTGQSLNVADLNLGASLFANSYKLDTCYGAHAGILASSDINIYAAQNYVATSTAHFAAIKASVEAGELDVKNSIRALDEVNLKATKEAAIGADVNANDKINISGTKVKLQKKARLNGNKGIVSVAAQDLVDEGSIDSQFIDLQAKKVTLKDGSQLNLQGADALAKIQTENLTAEKGSKLNAPAIDKKDQTINDRLLIFTAQADLQEGSDFNLRNGGMKAVATDNIASAASINAQLIQMQAKNVELTDGSQINLNGPKALMAIQADNFKAEKGSSLVADKQPNQENAPCALLLANNIELQKDSKFDIGNGGIQAQAKNTLATATTIDAKTVQMQGNQVNVNDGSNIHLNGPKAELAIQANTKLTVATNSAFTAEKQLNSEDAARALLLANDIELQKDSKFDMCNAGIQAQAKNTVATAATINSQTLHMQAKEVALKDKTTINVNGPQALLSIQSDNFKSEKGSSVVAASDANNNTEDRVILLVKKADLKEGSKFNVGNGVMKVAADTIANAADVSGQMVRLKGNQVTLKDKSSIHLSGPDALLAVEAKQTFKAESGSSFIADKQPNQENALRAFLLANDIELQKDSTFDAGNGGIKAESKNNLTSAASINAQTAHMQGPTITLQKVSEIRAVGDDPKVILQSQKKVTTESGSEIIIQETGKQEEPEKKATIIIDAPISDLQKDSSFEPGKGLVYNRSEQTDLAATMKGRAQIDTKNLTIKKDSNLDLLKLNVNAGEKIIQEANLIAAELALRAKYVENSGKINTEKAAINADRYYWNTGSVISKNTLQIDTPVSINWRSYTQAKNLTTNALVDLNLLSWDKTQTSSHNALLSLDLSLHLPMTTKDAISSSWEKFTAMTNIGSSIALSAIAPQIYLAYRIGMMALKIPSMYTQGKELYADIKKMADDPNAKESDWVPIINRAAQLALSTVSAAGTAFEAASAAQSEIVSSENFKMVNDSKGGQLAKEAISKAKGLKGNLTTDALKATLKTGSSAVSTLVNDGINLSKDFATKKLTQAAELPNLTFEDLRSAAGSGVSSAVSAAGAASGYVYSAAVNDPVQALKVASKIASPLVNQNYSRTAFIDLNYGPTLTFNCSSTNLVDHSAAKICANYNLDSCYGRNVGFITASNVSISAKKYQNGISADIGGYKIETPAMIAAQDVYIKVDSFKGSSNSAIATANGGTSLDVKEIDNKGTTHGKVSLKFSGRPEQFKNIGTINSQGETFSYNGTVATPDTVGTNLPTVDELAKGHGKWGIVRNAAEIRCDAGDKDAHLKEQHDIAHTFRLKTKGSIQADQKISSQKGSISLVAGQDLRHSTLVAAQNINRVAENGTITAESTSERVTDGANYEDKINQVSVIAGHANTAYAGKDIIQTGVELKTGKEGIDLRAKGNIRDNALHCTKHTEHKTGTEYTKDTKIDPHGCHYNSEGKLVILAEGAYSSQAGHYASASGEKIIQGAQGTHISEGRATHLHESHRTEKRWFSSGETNEKTFTDKSVVPQFSGYGKPFTIGNKESQTTLVAPVSNVPVVIQGAPAAIEQGKNLAVSEKNGETTYLWTYISKNEEHKEDRTYSMAQLPGIENYAKELLVETVKGQTCAFLNTIQNFENGTITEISLKELHHVDIKSSGQLTTGAKVVLAIAVGAATKGLGAPLVAGLCSWGVSSAASTVLSHMTIGTINCLLNQAVNTLVETGGDIEKAAELMASSQTLKGAALAALSAGAVSGADQLLTTLGVPSVQHAANFSERLVYAAPREFIHAGIKTGLSAFAGQSLKEAMLEQTKAAVAGSLHTALVSQIADLYAHNHINSVNHKLLHGAAGAVYGGIIGGKNGALAGGVGAFSAEVAAELVAPSKRMMDALIDIKHASRESLTQQEFMASYASVMQEYMHKTLSAQQVAQMTAAITALAAGQDVAIAHQTALTALDNNFLVLAMYGITAASTAYSGYKIYQSYQEDGAIGALKQLGIEVAYNAAGQVVARAGSMVFPSVRAAVVAALDEAPALKLILGNLTDKIIIAAERINQTAIAKAVSKVETALLEKEAQLLGRLGIKTGAAAEGEFIRQEEHAVEELVLADSGIRIKVKRDPQNEIAVLRSTDKLGNQSQKSLQSFSCIEQGAPAKPTREVVLPKMQTYDEARNKALEIIGEVDPHSAVPHIGELHTCKDKLCGLKWEKNKVIMRLDYDPVKGPHINVGDFRKPVGSDKFAIPFEGNEKTVKSLLKHLNTKADLEQAKAIYSHTNNEKDLIRITNMIENLNKKRNKYEKRFCG